MKKFLRLKSSKLCKKLKICAVCSPIFFLFQAFLIVWISIKKLIKLSLKDSRLSLYGFFKKGLLQEIWSMETNLYGNDKIMSR
jgi:hypothetical protein